MSSRISLTTFYLVVIFITSSLLLPSVTAPSPLAANAMSSKNMHISSNTVESKTQLPLPMSGMISQFTDGQGVVCASGPGSSNTITINNQGQGVVCASGPGSSSSSIVTSDNINSIGNKIQGLNLPQSSITSENVITCRPLVPCIGTNSTDIIMAGINEQVFGLNGNDMIFGAADDQSYGNGGNDIILTGAGNSLADGGSGDDVLMGGIGHSLLVGGPGNDKIFAGPGDTVMGGGSGANHFDCPASIAGLARSVVLDYNPANGDTISGQCTLVNNMGHSDGAGGGHAAASQVTLPNTEEASSPDSGSSGIEGVIASSAVSSGG
jgi:hypothetical protein